MKKYNVKYHCGCIKELEENDPSKNEPFHKPTGKNIYCDYHKLKGD